MDLETENRIAAILLKEAAELRRQAQQEGALAYLRQPTARGRPNSRFLNATIRGIEQANRAVEVNEMWQARQKELELDGRPKGDPRDEGCRNRDRGLEMSNSRTKGHDSDASSSSSKQLYEDFHSSEDNGLRDKELEEFLQSRVKRGRGSIGPRMDETGPYLPPSLELYDGVSTSANFIKDEKHRRAFLGPEKPSSLKCREPSDEEYERKQKKSKKSSTRDSGKRDSKKQKSKYKSRDKKKKEKRHKH